MNTSRLPQALAVVTTLAMFGAACAGGDAADDPLAAAADEPSSDTDEGLVVWADQLIAAVGEHETRQASLGIGGATEGATAPEILAALGEQANSLASLAEALPGDPPSGELLTSRYQAFVAAHADVADAAAATASNPDDTMPWAYGDATDTFIQTRDDWLESCFALQEAIADNDLGVLGCVGLTGVEDDAEAAFGNMLRAGMGVLLSTIPDQLGRDNPLAVTEHQRHLNVNKDGCQPEDEQPKIDEIARYAADIATLIIEDDLGNIAVDLWVLPDAASAAAFTDILDRLFMTRRTCMMLRFDNLLSFGWDEEEHAELNLGVGNGYWMTIFALGERPIHYQVAAASQGNVAALFTAATQGEMWSEREIEETIGNAIVGGTR